MSPASVPSYRRGPLHTGSAKTSAGQAERVPGYEMGIVLIKNRAMLLGIMCLKMELGDFWDFHEIIKYEQP